MKVVIDFSACLHDNEYMIKEFCMYFISSTQFVRDCLIVTKTPIDNDLQKIEDYKSYYVNYGIPPDNENFYDISTLREKIAGTLDINQKIYIREKILPDILNDFVGIKYSKFKYLEDLGFDIAPLRETDCSYHDGPSENYCAGDNARVMTNWLLEKSLAKAQLRYNMQAIINFNGYYNYDNNKFIIKEICIYGLDAAGSIIYRKLYVTAAPHYIFNLVNTIDHYNQLLYDKYGIQWTDGTYKPSQINNRLNNILRKASVKYIFVQNFLFKNILSTIIEDFPSYEVISLDEFIYDEEVFEQTTCSFHTHPTTDKNNCIENGNKRMAAIIQNMKLYRDDVKNLLT